MEMAGEIFEILQTGGPPTISCQRVCFQFSAEESFLFFNIAICRVVQIVFTEYNFHRDLVKFEKMIINYDSICNTSILKASNLADCMWIAKEGLAS